jgi:hypothetical protein
MTGEPVQIDLTHAFNRLVDTWYDLFKGDVATHMPGSACALPGNFDDATVQRVNNEATHTHWSLRWNQTAKATDSMWETRRLFSSISWDLHVSWDGMLFEQDQQQYYLIDNAIAYVELTDPSQSLTLDVSGSFGHPHFEGHIARLPVWFNIVVHDGSTTVRNEQRGWEITGDGRRDRLG